MVIIPYYVEASTKKKPKSQQKALSDVCVKSCMNKSNRATASIKTPSSKLKKCGMLHDARYSFTTQNPFHAPNDVCFIF